MEENNGWIRLHRCLLGKAIWKCSNNDQRVILVTVLMLANHEPNQWLWKGKKFECQAGQFVTSYSSLAKTCDTTVKTVRNALAKFENLEFLVVEGARTGLLITIENWGKYQGCLDEKGTKEADQGQTRGRPGATNKNDKNDKNNKNNNKSLDISLDILSGSIETYTEITDYLNLKTGQHYRPTTRKTQDCIKARLNEGFTIDDFKKVIDIKSADWGKDAKMYQYLRPETLFGNKFESYLNQIPKPKVLGKYQEDISAERMAEYDAIKL